jgi:hypothetical protein
MRPSKWPEGPLTQAEYTKFQMRRKRVILGVAAIFSFAVFLGINDKFLHFTPPMALLFLFAVPIMLWTLIQMFKFQCPRCGTMPMTMRASLGAGEGEVGNYMALRPKKCHKCGVLFEPPLRDSARRETADAEV